MPVQIVITNTIAKLVQTINLLSAPLINVNPVLLIWMIVLLVLIDPLVILVKLEQY